MNSFNVKTKIGIRLFFTFEVVFLCCIFTVISVKAIDSGKSYYQIFIGILFSLFAALIVLDLWIRTICVNGNEIICRTVFRTRKFLITDIKSVDVFFRIGSKSYSVWSDSKRLFYFYTFDLNYKLLENLLISKNIKFTYIK